MAVELDTAGLLIQLRECLCGALAVTPEGAPCRCCVVHGDRLTWDECECGLGWVRLAGLAPMPQTAQQRRQSTGWDGDTCLPDTNQRRLATVELGILRCAVQPNIKEGEVAPSCACLEAEAIDLTADIAALHAAVECCADDLPTGITVGQWTPLGPGGLCVGGSLSITVPVQVCPDCPDESPGESPGEVSP